MTEEARTTELHDSEALLDTPLAVELRLLGECVSFDNLVDVVQWHLKRHPDRRVFRFLTDGERETGQLNFVTLDAKARAIAAELRSRYAEGERALLMFPNGLELVTAFYGCLYAGICAVPVYPPQNRSSYLQRLEGIAADCGAKLILGTEAYLTKVGDKLSPYETLSRASTVAIDTIGNDSSRFEMPRLSGTSTAFLQYTSGSTSAPKGVVVSHGNLLHNIASMQRRFSIDDTDVIVSWLPLFHDMGLIGAVLQTISLGASCVVMSPAAFLQKPVRWLQAIAEYRGTTTFAPNFAYELCTRKIDRSEIARLDLSSWTMALNGAEPIKPGALETFESMCAPAGMPKNAVYPGYGLAEATLYVSGSQRMSSPRYLNVDVAVYEQEGRIAQAGSGRKSRRLVSSGMPNPHLDVVVVDPERHERCADGAVGEIWVSGGSVAQGYWGKPRKTEARFAARMNGESGKTYLRTGDLGFLWEGHLFISGRIDDVLVIRGANHYPQDIEDLVQSRVAGLKAGGGAAFTVDVDGECGLVLVHEVERTCLKKIDAAEAFRHAARHVSEELGLSLHCLALIRPSTLPKTSSGKVQRSRVKARFVADELALVALESSHVAPADESVVAAVRETALPGAHESKEIADLVDLLSLVMSRRTGLPLKEVDANQPVASFGLDSLALADLAETITTMCGVRISLGRLLEAQALIDVARLILAMRNQSSDEPPAAVDKGTTAASEDDAFPLSLNQTQMLLAYQKAPDSAACNVPCCIAGSFDVTRLRHALDQVAGAHPILAARFEFDGETQQWRQRIGRLPEPLLVETDVSHLDDKQIRRLLVERSKTPFSIGEGCAFRFELFTKQSNQQWLLLNFHHVAVDLLSINGFVDGLLRSYREPERTPAAPGQRSYREFVEWQRAFIDSSEGQAVARYWRRKLGGEQSALQWPVQTARTERGGTTESFEFTSGELTSERLQQRAKRAGVTVNALLLAAYQVFLAKLCTQRCFDVGVAYVGRPDKSFQDTLGYFVEPAVFAADIPLHQPLEDLVRETQAQLVEIIDHAGAALHVHLEGSGGGPVEPRAYQILFTYYPHRPDWIVPFNADMSPTPVPGAPGLSHVPLPAPGSQLDVSLVVADDGERPQFRFEFDRRLFDSRRVATFAGYYLRVLEAFVASPSATTADVSLISDADKVGVRGLLDGAKDDFGESRPVHALIEENVRRHPDRVAVRFEDESLTYAELNEAADLLAARIADRARPRTAVGVFADRSFDMVTSLLAVLKAGCAYVPINPGLPPDRNAKIVESAELKLLLLERGESTKQRFDALVESVGDTLEVIDVGDSPGQASASAENVHDVRGDDLAYIIFTSGSTGEPKGVMNTHAALLNRLLWMKSEYSIDRDDRILQKTPFTFDVSVWEFFLPLISSATLVLARPDGHKDSVYLSDLIGRERVTALHFVPSMLDAFLADPESSLHRTKQVFCSGEELSASLQRRFFTRFSPCRLHNLYGPTEAAIDVSHWSCIDDESAAQVPIGSAISNIELHVLDPELQPVPANVTGELYIAGEGLARGYVNRPDLTADKFVPNPFASRPGQRMYQTGDLVQYGTDGSIYYLGRTDSQVKIRGFRIELNDIDTHLRELPNVCEAVTIVVGSGADKKLASYLVYDGAEAPASAAAVRQALASRLPDYMVPSFISVLDAMPLNANGKLDRKSLPAPTTEDPEVRVPPKGEREHALAEIWAQVLAIDVQQISRDHDFFALGGHSLSAAKVAANCKSRLGSELSLRDIFSKPMLREQATELRRSGAEQDPVPVRSCNVTHESLAYTQARIWFLSEFQEQGAAYNVPVALGVSGPLDADALTRSVSNTVARHEILRTRYGSKDNEPYQIVDPVAELVVERRDLRSLDPRSTALQRDKLMAGHAEAPFKLAEQWPVRAMLIEEQAEQSTLLLCFHHIAVDGISVALLIDEIGQGYQQVLGNASPPAPTRLQYRDYVHWQRDRIRGERRERLLEFWADRLADTPPLLSLPADRVRPARQTISGACLDLAIDSRLAARLKRVARQVDASLFMILVGAYKYLLSVYSGTEDIVVGMPVSGRVVPDLDDIIGFFANTVVLRTTVKQSATVGDLLRQVRDATFGAYENQEMPLQLLVEELQPQRSPSYSPIFQVLFSLEHAQDLNGVFGPAGEPTSLQVTKLKRPHVLAKFDLALMLEEKESGIDGYFEFNTDLFETTTIERMRAHFLRILDTIVSVEEPIALCLGDIDLPSPEEKRRLLDVWNSAPEIDAPASIVDVFRANVERYPDRVAIVCDADRLSYRELDARSSVLAGSMQRQGLSAGGAVGLHVNAGINPVIGMLATVKCGAYYVPLDPRLPKAVLARIVDAVEPSCLLTEDGMPTTGFSAAPSISIDGVPHRAGSYEVPVYDPDDLAYVMFTSGSTGESKGVEITQRGILRLVVDPNYVELNGDTVALQAASLAFDAATFEIWGALLNGGQLVVHAGDVLTAASLADLIRQSGVNTAWITASLFSCLVDQDPRCLTGLRYLLVGGDVVSPEHVSRVYEQCPDIEIINGYGPTECTTFAAFHPIDRDDVVTPRGTIAIGRPINNTQLHVLDAAQNLVPVGVVGELYIGGDGLARGYLGAPELSREKFVECKLDSDLPVRLYRSGDLVRRLPDGVLEFVGRTDDQVKIRGFRIELSEINATLSLAPGVRSCATIVAGDPVEKQVVSYVTGDDVDTEAVRAYLRQALPNYMVPTFVVSLDAIPLTRNGKLDVEALPDFRLGLEVDAVDAPATAQEQLLADIWADLLGLAPNQISRKSHFFELGGHSLLAARMVADVNSRQDVEIDIRDVFESPVLARLAAGLGNERSRERFIDRVPRNGLQELSYAQSRIWFLAQLERGRGVYNVPLTLKLVGKSKSDDGSVVGDHLVASIRSIVRRHESLRTRFKTVDGVPKQYVETDAVDFEVERIRWADEDEQRIESFAAEYHARPFDLDNGLPIRACVISDAADRYWLLVCIHHIVTDGWSMDLLVEELAACYNHQTEPSSNGPLPALSIQYVDFACWQRRWLDGERSTRQLHYWREQLAALSPKLDLPTDYPRPRDQSFAGRCREVRLPDHLPGMLAEVCRREGCTTYMLMLAALKVLLARYSGDDDVAVGSPVANRPVAELAPLIGFFANTLVRRTQVGSELTVERLINDVKQNTLAGYSNQDLPFEVLVEQLQPERSLSYSPLFQVMFSLEQVTASLPRFEGLSVELVRQEHSQSKFDLSFMLRQDDDAIGGYIEYSTALFEHETIERMWRQYVHVLEQMAADPALQVRQIKLERDEPIARLYAAINTATVEVPPLALNRLFEVQAERTPDAVAVRHSGDHLTYRQLNSLANAFARTLIDEGVSNHSSCAVFLPRTMDLLVALLAIHKSGGFYVPVDPNYPAQRIADILTSAQPRVVVTSRDLLETLPPDAAQTVVLIDECLAETSRDRVERNLDREISIDQTAYVIYTSGSTGKPKGIAITHRNAATMLTWGMQEYSSSQLAGVLAGTSICFDLSVYELFLPLAAGGCVHLVEDFLSLLEYPAESEVTLVNTVPSAMEAFLQAGTLPASVSTVNLAGEPLSRALVDKLYQLPHVAKVYNLYGPSEDTTYSTFALVPRESAQKPSIGRPIANTCAYVLDSELNRLPAGVAGELYLSGDGVSLGYIGRVDQTAASYVPDPFSSRPGSRMYRTGDTVRLRSDGELDYLGRGDRQVKIRGFRIELGEIESVLEQHDDVGDVAVVVNTTTNAGNVVVAFVSTQSSDGNGESPPARIERLRRFLLDRLPDYMQPTHWQLLPELPLLPNGKVDRKQLAARRIELDAIDEIVAPETDTERALAAIWSDLLGAERLCRRQNFFTLGGHSLLATQLQSRVRDAFAVGLTIRDVFQYPTIEDQANLVDLLQASDGMAAQSDGGRQQHIREEGAI